MAMILGFKQKLRGKPTYFKEKILLPTKPRILPYGAAESWYPKLHTIREDKADRWRAERSIQMVYRGKYYSIADHFNKGIPELEKCISVQDIRIDWEYEDSVYVFIDGSEDELPPDQVKRLAINDGFESVEDFFAWFKKDFEGKIIHWTNLRYK